jgi:RNA polymerase sigma-70 factor (ECF subfamily)
LHGAKRGKSSIAARWKADPEPFAELAVLRLITEPEFEAQCREFCGQYPSPRGYLLGGVIMAVDSSVSGELQERIERGDESALLELFASHRDRLKRMVKLRLDRRLQGRLDASDVLQEAYIDVARRAREYVASPAMPVFLWLRFITGQRLVTLHRKHLGSKARDAGLEVSLCHGAWPQATSVSLAAMLLGRLTSPTRAALRAELQRRVQDALNAMEPIDREILTLRHFEELNNNETAQVLGIGKTAASNRYVRALKRLKDSLAGIPGFLDS